MLQKIEVALLIGFVGFVGVSSPSNLRVATGHERGGFAVKRNADAIEINYNNQPVCEYVFNDSKIPRPYFTRLRAPDGTQVTRNHPPRDDDATDHKTLHPGLWMAFGDLNGVDFWRNAGRIEHTRFVQEPVVQNERLEFAVEEIYKSPQDDEVCRGINRFAFVPGTQLQPAQPGTLLIWNSSLKSSNRPLVFGPQHEMGLGFRVATPITVEAGGGQITGSHGGRNEAGNWGRVGQWWDYSGNIDGVRGGLFVAAATENMRPMWAHARGYGFLAMNPTGPPAGGDDVPSVAFTVPADQWFDMKFGVLMYSEGTSEMPEEITTEQKLAQRAASVQQQLANWTAIDPSQSAARAVPTFECMSLYWDVPDGSPSNRCTVRYRKLGSDLWRPAQPLWFDREAKQYRGSVVNLDNATTYEFELALSNKASSTTRAMISAATWDNDFPIASTETLAPGVKSETLKITKGGSPAGYRLVVASPSGTTIDVDNQFETCVSIEADYVIVRGLKCVGAKKDGMTVSDRHHVVIEDCEISNWGGPDPHAGKKFNWGGTEIDIPATLGNHMDAAIRIVGTRAQNIVIQGNRLHHARYTANNWTQPSPYFSNQRRRSTHPQGPNAVVFDSINMGNHVIRWNDVGHDSPNFDHMFNDALLASEPKGNGFSCDSDIYGNRISDCWDDGIEAERGDRNVRVWSNHFSRVVKCVSTGYIWAGPLYVYRNVAADLLHPNEMPAHNGGRSPFGSHPPCFIPPPQEDPKEGRDGIVYVYHNTLVAGAGAPAGWAFNTWPPHTYTSPTIRLVSRNNLWETAAYPDYFNTPNEDGLNYFVRDFLPSYFDQDYDLHNGVITPASTAGPNTIQSEATFKKNQGSELTNGWQLAEHTDGHDDALRISNFNDDFMGEGPDRGAYETNGPNPQFGRALYRQQLDR